MVENGGAAKGTRPCFCRWESHRRRAPGHRVWSVGGEEEEGSNSKALVADSLLCAGPLRGETPSKEGSLPGSES